MSTLRAPRGAARITLMRVYLAWRRHKGRCQTAQTALTQQGHDLRVKSREIVEKVGECEHKAIEIALHDKFLDHVRDPLRAAGERYTAKKHAIKIGFKMGSHLVGPPCALSRDAQTKDIINRLVIGTVLVMP